MNEVKRGRKPLPDHMKAITTSLRLRPDRLSVFKQLGGIKFLNEVLDTIKKAGTWYDESNAQIDYFNTAFYIDINIGRWDKPYVYNNKVSLSNVIAFNALQELGKLQLVYVK